MRGRRKTGTRQNEGGADLEKPGVGRCLESQPFTPSISLVCLDTLSSSVDLGLVPLLASGDGFILEGVVGAAVVEVVAEAGYHQGEALDLPQLPPPGGVCDDGEHQLWRSRCRALVGVRCNYRRGRVDGWVTSCGTC